MRQHYSIDKLQFSNTYAGVMNVGKFDANYNSIIEMIHIAHTLQTNTAEKKKKTMNTDRHCERILDAQWENTCVCADWGLVEKPLNICGQKAAMMCVCFASSVTCTIFGKNRRSILAAAREMTYSHKCTTCTPNTTMLIWKRLR